MAMAPLSVPRVNSSAGAAVPALACPFPAQALPSCARWERCPKNDVGSLAGACRDPSDFGEVKADLAAT